MADSVNDVVSRLNDAIFKGRALVSNEVRSYLHHELRAPLQMLLHLYMETCSEGVVPIVVFGDHSTHGDLDGSAICEVPEDSDADTITREIWRAGIRLTDPR